MAKRKRSLPPWGVGLQTTLGLGAAGAAGHFFEFHPALGFGVGAVGGLCAVVANAERWGPPARVLMEMGRWGGLGSWLTWAWFAEDPYTLGTAATLAGGAQVAAHLRPVIDRIAAAPADSEPGTGVMLRAQAKTEAEWQARIRRVTRLNVEITDYQAWDSGAGFTLTLLLPAGGSTRQTLMMHADGLAADARLPEGCGVEVLPGPHRGSAVLHVSTLNRMVETVAYPADYSPRSILEQVALGEHRNAEAAGPHLRENAGLIVGMRGSGKTTLLNVLTAGIGRCTDALVWHIDLTGGGLSLNWLTPWLEGDTDKPAVDWAVNTVEDAIAMVRAAVAISKVRKSSGHARKRAANTTLLPIGADLPEIVIVIDEGKTILAPSIRDKALRFLRETVNEVLDIARDSAVNVVFSALGATSASLDPALKSQCAFKLAMRCEKEAELAYLYDWGQASMDELAGVGTGFIREEGEVPRPFRSYNLDPERIISDLAPEVSKRQPVLDDASALVAGPAYAGRYERMREMFSGTLPVGVDDADTADLDDGLDSEGFDDGWGDPADIASAGGTAVLARPAVGAAPPKTRVPRELAWITREAEESGQERVRTTWLIDQLDLDMTPRRLGMLLSSWGAPVGRQEIRGEEVRGPLTADLVAAVERIDAGGPIDVEEAL